MCAVVVDASAFLPEQASLEALLSAASGCRGCDLRERCTEDLRAVAAALAD